MAITINTNIPTQQAQISLERAQNGMDTSMQRLATGYRINSAADDAAGLQISNRMTAQINGLTVAVRNANDGISIAQTAEGAMGETTALLQQMRDLAVQSASDSNSASDRGALNEEVLQLVAEVNRIASATSFAGQNLLDGSFVTKNIQVGAYANEVIPITVSSTAGDTLGIKGSELTFAGFTLGQPTEVTAAAPGGVAAQSLTVNVNGVGTVVPIEQGASASEIVLAVSDAVPDILGRAKTSVTVDGVTPVANTALTITVNGVDATFTPTTTDAIDAYNGLAAALKALNIDAVAIEAVTGPPATPASLVITDPSGANMLISASAAAKVKANSYDGTAPGSDGTAVEAGKEYMASGAIQWISTNPNLKVIFTSSDTMLGAADTPVLATVGDPVDMTVNTLDIRTYDGAQQAIRIVDFALADIDSNRASLGAIQNRFQHTIYNLQNVRENMMASRSRIEDTDYASEMSTLTKEQVLKQASMSSLNRANLMQQDALKLLQ